jgi:hypothetical protein
MYFMEYFINLQDIFFPSSYSFQLINLEFDGFESIDP